MHQFFSKFFQVGNLQLLLFQFLFCQLFQAAGAPISASELRSNLDQISFLSEQIEIEKERIARAIQEVDNNTDDLLGQHFGLIVQYGKREGNDDFIYHVLESGIRHFDQITELAHNTFHDLFLGIRSG